MKIINLMRHLKGAACFLMIAANLFFWLVPLIVLTLFKIILPQKGIQDLITRLTGWIYMLAVWCDDLVLCRVIGIRVEVEGAREFYPEKFYLVIANHQNWNDVLILQRIFNRRAPVLKFLAKKELVFMPLVGLICWAYDYPFLRRRSQKGMRSPKGRLPGDFLRLERSLEKFMSHPATVVNLVEGTRFSPLKAQTQGSPYRNLMKPKAVGLQIILGLLGDKLGSILDVTIVYDCHECSFWNFVCGGCKRVVVRVREHAPDDIADPEDFGSVAGWINRIWQEKDLEIGSIKSELTGCD